MTHWNEDKVWSVLQDIRSDISFDKKCGSHGLYSDVVEAQVQKVEERLTIKSHDTRLDNVTNKDLQSGAEMFIYLNICQDLQRSWFLFFTYLLQNQPLDKILLTLNRIFKGGAAKRTSISQKIFNNITSMFSLKYELVHNIMNGKVSPIDKMKNVKGNNSSFK